MKQKQTFTLVELLVVIGIIAILAGLVIPAVIKAQMQGRITQAKSDMANILLALKGVESTYNKMVNGNSFSSHSANAYPSGGTECIRLGGDDDSDDDDSDDDDSDTDAENQAYDSFIAELTVPQMLTASALNINKRRIKFLDPNPKFNPNLAYNHADNLPYLWRDPWGKRYIIIINTALKDEIPNPADNDIILAARAVVYSRGPNGTNDDAQNILYNVGNPESTDDDIASWH